eukprot:UN09001
MQPSKFCGKKVLINLLFLFGSINDILKIYIYEYIILL